jgi:hypothetical protein
MSLVKLQAPSLRNSKTAGADAGGWSLTVSLLNNYTTATF